MKTNLSVELLLLHVERLEGFPLLGNIGLLSDDFIIAPTSNRILIPDMAIRKIS